MTDWAAALTALVALVALGLSIFNTRQARRAPARARQDELWDSLEQRLRPVVSEMKKCQEILRRGGDPPKIPTAVVGLDQMRDLAPRFAGNLTESEITLRLLDPLWLVFEGAWSAALSDQARVAYLDGLTGNQEARGPDEVAEHAREREVAVRRRDASFRRLEGKLAEGIVTAEEWMRRANNHLKR